MFIFETETDHEQGRVRGREGDTESEAGSRLWAVHTEPDMGPKSTNWEIITWDEVRGSTHWAARVPPTTRSLIYYRVIGWWLSVSLWNQNPGLRAAWVAQSVKCHNSAQVMILPFVSLSPASGSVWTAQSLEPASDSVSPSLSLPLPHSRSVSVSLSLKNKQTLKKIFLITTQCFV